MQYPLLLFLAAFVLALGFTPVLRILALNLKVLDHGRGGRMEHPGAVPSFGGVAIFAASVLPLLYLLLTRTGATFHADLAAILVGSFLIFSIGLYDDIRSASVWSRLVVEFAAAFLVYSVGIKITSISDPFGNILHLGWLSLPVTLLWIVAITNAVNLIDGVDGLAAGTGILIVLTIVLLNWGRIDYLLLLSIFPVLGALVGFLVYNFPPASIFMGDSGSLFLGFFLSTFAIVGSSGVPGSKTVWITALAFSLPLLDMAYAILRRWYRGVSIFTADKDHLHHKLLQKGLSKRRVVLLFYAANMVLMLALIVLVKVHLPRTLVFLILFVLNMAAFAVFQFMSDLKPIDFFRKVLLLFSYFRRRRYHLYLINRFERGVEKKDSLDEIRVHLDQLFQDYVLAAVEIRITCSGRQDLLYQFGAMINQEIAMHIEFPLRHEGVGYGNVILHKQTGNEYILCVGELAGVLSKYLAKIINKTCGEF